ncbi:MAG TPA: hypothetical protein VF649_11670 [Sphingomonas sp.]|jgi:hypothetical protein|uniref:hypothetical protein n=1 Tax=Sphingomonas sp. TaxID=28214 RepID=UPI002ED86F10
MAESPSHRFGQVVGNLLEEILKPELLRFCDERGLYLDRHGSRINVRKGRKVAWEDKYGNSHDLDFVIEKDGSDDARGRPVAFIEAAWRRYTKHSRAKAQEIQGAVLPIAETYALEAPFLGAVLAGIFTAPSLDQLRSLNFNIVYLPYDSIVDAFAGVGIDARFDEQTPDAAFRTCVDRIGILAAADREKVKRAILDANAAQFDDFFVKLRRKLDRTTRRVTVLPLFGTAMTFGSATEAGAFIGAFDPATAAGEFRKYEVSIVFSNGDEVRGMFADQAEANRFLRYVTS